MSTNTDDLRIRNLRELLIPEQLIEEMPAQGGVCGARHGVSWCDSICSREDG